MRNRVTNYLSKVSINHVKDIADWKKHMATEILCEDAMDELKKIYWHEKELLISIPILMKTASTFELVESLTMLADYTTEHITLLEKKFPEISKIHKPIKTYNLVSFKNIV